MRNTKPTIRLSLLVLLLLAPAGVSAAIPSGTTSQNGDELSEAERHNNLGTQHAARGAYRQAAGEFRKAIAADPSMTIAHYNLGLALSRVENHEDAVFAYTSAVRLSPRYFDAWFQLGLSRLATEDYKEAVSAYEECLALRPQNPASLFRLGQAYWKTGQWHEVVKTWETLLNTDPSHASVRIVVRELPRAYYNVGLDHQANGRIDDAQEAYEDALRLDARYVPSLNNLGVLFQRRGENEKALNLFRRAVEVDGKHIGARLGLAGALKSTGNYAEAMQAYLALETASPDDDRVYRGLVLCSAAMGDREQANRWLDKALKRMDPYAGLLLKAYAQEHGDKGDRYGPGYDEQGALATYREIGERFPDRPESFYNLGVIHARGSRWDEAESAFDRALKINPDYKAAKEALSEIERIRASQNQEVIIEFKTGK